MQIRLANELMMPITIHAREADQEVMDILKEEGAFSKERLEHFGHAGVLLHCFSGSAELGKQYVKLGAYLSVAGPVTYKNNKAIGKATVTVTGKGAYTGSISKTFKIVPKKTTVKKVTSPKTKQLKVTYSKVSNITGYQITYSTSSKFTKAATKSVTSKTTSKTIGKLKKGKTYYVKVRTYKTVNGVKYYSGYSKVLKAKIK